MYRNNFHETQGDQIGRIMGDSLLRERFFNNTRSPNFGLIWASFSTVKIIFHANFNKKMDWTTYI
jgi:hypothetical protein